MLSIKQSREIYVKNWSIPILIKVRGKCYEKVL